MFTRLVFTGAFCTWALALTLSARALPAAPQSKPAAKPAAAPSATSSSNQDCFDCHDDDGVTREKDGSSVAVKPAVFNASVHESVACVECHTTLEKVTDFPHEEKLPPVDCASCHDEEVAKYATGVHAKARGSGSTVAAACVDCHGKHDMRAKTDPASPTHHLSLAATCAKCHGDAEIIRKGGIPSDVTKAFGDSIHGKALSKGGLVVAPTCSDCHGAHDILKPKDPDSRVARPHVPATCGKCHEGIARQFGAGVHGKLLAEGKMKAPACQTCHTAHDIQRTDKTSWQLSVIGECGTCHSERIETFRDTFHGQVTNLGFRVVAGCADCHGAHEILPASDPRSPVSPARLVQTCGKCHANASANFVKYDPHANKHDRQRNPALYYTSKFMSALLFGVFGIFGVHTSLWFTREVRLKRARRLHGDDEGGAQ
jgi:hypothetical protein